MSDSVQPHRRQPTRLCHPWDSPGKSIGVGCHILLQGIFPTQGSNLGLLQLPALAGMLFETSATCEAHKLLTSCDTKVGLKCDWACLHLHSAITMRTGPC